MVFLVGVREISCGIGALTRRRPVGWLLARVAGDAMDLALLNSARNSRGTQKNRLMAAMAAVIGIAMLDLRASLQLSRQRDTDSDTQGQGGILDVKKSITVNRSAEEVYGFWRDFQNLPRFMSHLEEVQVTGDRRSHWKAKAPAGKTVEWDAEITDDQPNRLIAWRSVGKADVDNSGSVRFVPAPGERGTEIHVEMHYNPPAGRLGAVVAKLFGEGPDWQVADDLRAFKQVMEVGEVVHSDASIHRRPHAAQPPKEMPTNLQERAAGQ
jgi:uncharacterized membrane protein